jgi:hypothetical protein
MFHELFVVQALACLDASQQAKGWTTYPRFMESLHAQKTGAHWSHEPFDLGIDEAMPSNCRFMESKVKGFG